MLFDLLRRNFINKEIKSLSSTFLDQVLVSLGNFLSTFTIIKFLGIEQFGIFSAIWIIIISVNAIQTAFIINPLLSISSKLKGKNIMQS